ncbi:Asp23/Gls24 family envelope stress response protein [Streptomyces panaciradicis]|uniref:Asp23/Gls24 family envelope stress response protein n=1 Tax=Streptomyces panaciradicis TaxID=1470261 RepID=UPI00201CFD11|nr:Asp23/Gls24 family envelope stress response protein [Streptomyces panaciradicis]MCL6668755.1 Asp23/Gls24 family envelope stress response protein [Streptomyces panaciradicis]
MTENTGVRLGAAPGSRGRTTIADVVVEKIAGMAARDVPGVYALGSGFARSMGSMRERMPGAGSGKSATRGVSVEVGELQAAIDLELVVEYGVSITDVAAAVREDVISAVERMAGREVVEVNVTVSDVKLPDEEDEGEERQRIQ